MPELATLELKVQRVEVEQATRALEQLAQKSGMAGDMARKLQGDFKSGAISADQFQTAAAKIAPAAQQAATGTTQLALSFERMRQAAAQRSADSMAAQFAKLDQFQGQVATSAVHAGQGLGRIQQGLAGVAVNTLSLNPQLSRLGASVAMFGMSGPYTLAMLGGLAALGLALRAFKDSTKEADDAVKAAVEHAKQLMQTAAATARLEAGRIATLEAENAARIARLTGGPDVGGALTRRIAALRDENAQLEIQRQALLKAADEAHTDTLKKAAADAKQALDAVTQTTNAHLQSLTARAAALAFVAQGGAGPSTDRMMREAEIALQVAIADTNLSYEQRVMLLQSLLALQAQMGEGALRSEKRQQEIQESMKNMLREMQSDLGAFFDDLVNNGLSSFEHLLGSISKMVTQMFADLAAKKLMARLFDEGGNLTRTGRLVGSGAAGLGVGFGIGRSTGSVGLGVLGGVASGALVGGPVGAAIGGLTGLVGAILGAGAAARKAAEDMKKLQESFGRALADVRNEVTLTGLDKALADVATQFADLREAARKAFLNAPFTLYHKALTELIRLENLRIEQLKAEAALLRARQGQDLDVRMLLAQGRGSEAEDWAFLRQQEREYQDAVLAGMDEVYLARLREVQQQEALRRAIDLAVVAREDELAALQVTLAETTRTVQTLRDYANQLRGTTGSPVQNLNSARAEFERVAALARAGDQAAAARLPQLGQQLLDQSRQYNASGIGYQQDVQFVLGIIDQLGDQFDVQRNLEQMQVDTLEQILAELRGFSGTWAEFLRLTGTQINLPIPEGGWAAPPAGGGVSPVVAVSQAGFTAVVDEVALLRAEVRALTVQTRRSMEALAL